MTEPRAFWVKIRQNLEGSELKSDQIVLGKICQKPEGSEVKYDRK